MQKGEVGTHLSPPTLLSLLQQLEKFLNHMCPGEARYTLCYMHKLQYLLDVDTL